MSTSSKPLPFTKSKVIRMEIVRIPDHIAKTQEQHDLCDMFQLRAITEDGASRFLSEVCGKQNMWILEQAQKSFLESTP